MSVASVKSIVLGLLLSLLVFVISIAFVFLLPESVKYLTKEVASFEVVVARYNEDLSWIAKEFPNERVVVYNKGKDDLNLPGNCQVIKLPNIGRESHTYLYHIVHNYNQLAERTLFLQGDPYSFIYTYTPLKKYKIIEKTNCNSIIAARCYYFNEKSERDKLLNLDGSKWSDTVFKNYDFIEFKNRFVDSGNENFHYNHEANFAVDRCKIIYRDLKYYEEILNTLDNVAPIEGHYLERLWDLVFLKNKEGCVGAV